MPDEVYMDIPRVRDVATQFGQISDVLKNVAQALEILGNILKSNAFTRLVGAAVIAFIDFVKPYIKQMADKCVELKNDLTASIDAYERGDAQGATRFY